jgi:RHH-type proline utilization regulon transcriptional repressor/proline dehydrogenase/delta 1-pyrroline-5-carboxylate dehydrogenase
VNPAFSSAEAEILALARDIHGYTRPAARSLLDRVLGSAMHDEKLLANLFRLLDVLPVLTGDGEISRPLREYLLARLRKLPAVLGADLPAAEAKRFSSLTPFPASCRRFPAGAHQVLPSARTFSERRPSRIPRGGYLARYSELIDTLTKETACGEPQSAVDAGPCGSVPRTNLSLKLSSLVPRLDPLDHMRCVEVLAQRLHPLFLQARAGRRARDRHGAVGHPEHCLGRV